MRFLALLALILAAACGTPVPDDPAPAEPPCATFTGTLTSCTLANPRGDRIPTDDHEITFTLTATAATVAVRPKPQAATDDDGWTVSTTEDVTSDAFSITASGSMTEGCLSDGGCRETPWFIELHETDDGYSGSYGQGELRCTSGELQPL